MQTTTTTTKANRAQIARSGSLRLKTKHPIAYDSPDHTHPWGAGLWGRTNPRFLIKLINLFPPGQWPSLLDLGCAGGAFVREAVDFGCDAYGLEGSDHAQKLRQCAWRDMPDRVFTCDISKPFHFTHGGRADVPVRRFDVITAWETVEHLSATGLCTLATNIHGCLKPNGMVILSTTAGSDCPNGVELHQTQMSKKEWITFFFSQGFTHHEHLVRHFNTQFVRGTKYGSETSFHLVLTRTNDTPPVSPKEPLALRLYDRWKGTLLQRFLAGDFVQR